MVLSLHSHSGEYCAHASGTLRQVVEQAIARGFAVYGLSEHAPRTRTRDLYGDEVALGWTTEDTHSNFESFVAEARALQREFADRICLLVGMETELIHADSLANAATIAATFGLDYLVGSVHHVNQIPIDYDQFLYAKAEAAAAAAVFDSKDVSVSPTETLFLQYFDAQFEMLSTLKPHVVGHFDLVSIFRPDHRLSENSWVKIKRNVDLIAEYGGIVEINSRAWKKGLEFAYPHKSIIQYMQSKAVKFCLSDDSHGPNDVGMHYSRLHQYIKDLGIDTVHYPSVVEGSSNNSDTNIKRRHVAIENIIENPFWQQF
ncbi:histidinolphosphatase [Physocladia obscura]|uniref:Histidinol-phosphatase n=1 Tax=Physocladia obscura TaxID=109957 RepID=A0AAD5T7H6_9FUNG|nr:histidinolphosphatase [Physocladia obscura]